MDETLTLQLRAGEPAWCPEGTHIIDPDKRVRMLEEDTDVTFRTREAYDNAVKMVRERRDRFATIESIQLPPAGASPQPMQEVGADRLQALLSRIEKLEAARSSEAEDTPA